MRLPGIAGTVTSTESSLTIVAATQFEAATVRRAAPGVRVVQSGVGLSRVGSHSYDAVISCGLAGGLREDVPTGTIVIPSEVATDQGVRIACDARMNEILVAAARKLGYEPLQAPLLSSKGLVTGGDRAAWAQRGFVAADMETGFLRARRLAALRVVLDTPSRELSPAWLRPLTVIGRPRLWPQALWLWRESPRCARLAGAVLAAAVADLAL